MWFQIGFLILTFLIGAYLGGLANLRVVRRKDGDVVIYPAPRCNTCGVPGAWYLRFPIFWYLFLWGRCHRCGRPLKLGHLYFELVGGVTLAGSLTIYGFTISTLTSLLSIFAILVLAILDYRYRIVPLPLAIGGLAVALLVAVLPGGIGLLGAGLGALASGGLLLLLVEAGLIDIAPLRGVNLLKMMFVAGAFLGLQMGLIAFALAAAIWGLARFISSIFGKQSDIIPVGAPALATTVLLLAYGDLVLNLLLATK